jgi:TonB family protein
MKVRHFFALALLIFGVCGLPSLAQSNNNQNSNQADEKIYEPSEVDHKAKITYKPEPVFTAKARKNHVSGKVVLRIVLKSSGEIGDIKVIKGLPDGLTEQCIKVARQIRFEPAMKDGHPVSQYIKREYNFNFM